ncbi:putative lipoprotein signal peptide [Bacillus phage Bolokhovo]|uniref:Putative lipoprotein signal peptide n=1 Tax=Bacillus phage Bolokhovo TaxID=2743970 RepID=A0A7D7PMP7_9CAUD|nr:putative lipoprotein signal peptide [Bacillus phage Bolokhovo]
METFVFILSWAILVGFYLLVIACLTMCCMVGLAMSSYTKEYYKGAKNHDQN